MATLGMGLILANSPQAKGRVERANGMLQDRLVKEMGLRGVGDIAAANALLDGKGKGGGFLANLHRRAPAAMRLDEVLRVHEERAVARDGCMHWRERLLQVDARHAGLDLPRPGRRVTVVERVDGSLLVRHGGRRCRGGRCRPGRPSRSRRGRRCRTASRGGRRRTTRSLGRW